MNRMQIAPSQRYLSIAIMVLMIHTPSSAQEVDRASDEPAQQASVEEIVVLGQSQNDLAMSAFRSGDFETAQKGFLTNARCALKRERALDSLVDNQIVGAQRAAAFNSAQNAPSSGGGGVGTPVIAQPSAQSSGATGGSFQGSSQKQAEEVQNYSCENRGFQYYMLGLSQIQLGKMDDALENLKRATNLSRNLYDAHYRVGLISIMSNDVKESKKRLKNIDRILKRCKKKCSVKQEIKERQQHLAKSIAEL